MKKKELIQLIKIKSDEVKIKDLSFSILKQVEHNNQLPTIELSAPKIKKFHFKWVLKPLMTLSLTVLIIVLSFSFLKPTPKTYAQEIYTHHQAIAISAMSSMFMIQNDFMDDLSILNYEIQAHLIEDEVTHLKRYVAWMEHLLNDHSVQIMEVEKTSSGVLFHYIVTYTSLNEEYQTYELKIYETYESKNGIINFTGEMLINEFAFAFDFMFNEKNTQQFDLKVHLSQTSFVKTSYHVTPEVESFTIGLHENEDILTEVLMQASFTSNIIDLTFTKGLLIGTYRFKFDDIKKQINVVYGIISNQISETGLMVIELIEDMNHQMMYRFIIKPQGGPVIDVSQNRPNMPNQNRPNMPNPNRP